MAKISKPEYEDKVKQLSKEETERLLSRMTGKLPRRLQKDKLSKEEALAIQMELEDDQLQEWRKMMRTLNKKEEAKAKHKTKTVEKTKAPAKPKALARTKATKAKTQSKPKVVEKAKLDQSKA